MRKGIRLWTFLFVIVIVSVFCVQGFLYAQEGQVTDTFDSAGLEDYEHSQDVVVTGGTLKLDPGNFVFRLGRFSNPVISLRFDIESPSSMILHYHASDKGAYGIQILDFDLQEMGLFAESEGQRSELGFVSIENKLLDGWNELKVDHSQGTHIVTLNGEEVFSIEDTASLEPGSVGIVCDGENSIIIDELGIESSEAQDQVAAEEQGALGEEETLQEMQVSEGEGDEQVLPSGDQVTETEQAQASSEGWKDFLSGLFVTGAPPIDMKTFLINLALSAVLAYILGLVYIHWGASLSNRRKFATNFILLTVTTTFIILVVRSSVALSLGLVGALSIVRFRAAIKEPEELAYLFLAIGLGIGLGDNQRIITLIAFVVAIVILGLLKLFRKSQADVNLHLNISLDDPSLIDLEDVQNALKPYVSKMKLLRFDKNAKTIEMSFLVEFRKIGDLNSARGSLEKLSDKINITFLDNKGIW